MIAFSTASYVLSAQDGFGADMRPWYSYSISKKISPRWSISQYGLAGMRSMRNDFWLSQVSLSTTFRVDRFWSLGAGYGMSLYKYGDWWEQRFDQDPILGNMIGFHGASLFIQHKHVSSKKISISHRITAQYFIPAFEKYRVRLRYTAKGQFSRMGLPLSARPYLEGSVYYYSGGDIMHQAYEDTDPPHGLHRCRIKIGINFRPLPNNKKVLMSLYYLINREFNISKGVGPVNVEKIDGVVNSSNTGLRHSNFQVFGIHFSYAI